MSHDFAFWYRNTTMWQRLMEFLLILVYWFFVDIKRVVTWPSTRWRLYICNTTLYWSKLPINYPYTESFTPSVCVRSVGIYTFESELVRIGPAVQVLQKCILNKGYVEVVAVVLVSTGLRLRRSGIERNAFQSRRHTVGIQSVSWFCLLVVFIFWKLI
jgi:hypothetical protein